MSQSPTARQVLSKFGPLLTGAEVAQQMGWDSLKVSASMTQWQKDGWVGSVAPHSDLYFNLSTYPESAVRDLDVAILRLMPSVVRIGARVLKESGLITQHAYIDEFAVLRGEPRYQVGRVELFLRGRHWYEVMGSYFERETTIPELSPGAALAEGLFSNELNYWCPAPDDIEFDMTDESVERDFRKVLPELMRLHRHEWKGGDSYTAIELYESLYEERLKRQSRHK